MESPLAPLARALHERSARFVLIGVGGANFYALGGSTMFMTADRDLFLPLDPDDLIRCWSACEATGLDLWSGQQPLDSPRDRWLAERVVERQALTRATGEDLQVDLTLVMKGFDFETVWNERHVARIDVDEHIRIIHTFAATYPKEAAALVLRRHVDLRQERVQLGDDLFDRARLCSRLGCANAGALIRDGPGRSGEVRWHSAPAVNE